MRSSPYRKASRNSRLSRSNSDIAPSGTDALSFRTESFLAMSSNTSLGEKSCRPPPHPFKDGRIVSRGDTAAGRCAKRPSRVSSSRSRKMLFAACHNNMAFCLLRRCRGKLSFLVTVSQPLWRIPVKLATYGGTLLQRSGRRRGLRTCRRSCGAPGCGSVHAAQTSWKRAGRGELLQVRAGPCIEVDDQLASASPTVQGGVSEHHRRRF
jgi:hypothetical protein